MEVIALAAPRSVPDDSGGASRRGRRGQHPPKPLESVLRTVDVLEYLLDAPGDAGVSDVARATGQSPAAAYRILATLAVRGLVTYQPREQRYRPGPRLLEYAFGLLRRLDVRRLSRPYLERLVRETSETAVLALRTGDERMYAAQVESPREVRQTITLGSRVPLHSGASGKAILSGLSAAELAAYLERSGLPALTPHTLTDRGALQQELERVRTAGYATSSEESFADTASVAAPVFNHDGEPVAALMLCGPASRFSPERFDQCGRLVRALAAALSAELGFNPGEEKG